MACVGRGGGDGGYGVVYGEYGGAALVTGPNEGGAVGSNKSCVGRIEKMGGEERELGGLPYLHGYHK